MLTLEIISWVFLSLGLLAFIITFFDITMGRYQPMAMMNSAWMITSIYMGLIGLFMYFKYGRAQASAGMDMSKMKDHSGCGQAMMKQSKPVKKTKPMWALVFISSTHCGAGCGLADIVSELLIFFAGITLWGHAIWASFFIDYCFALVFGLAFQYYNIMPMRPELGKWQGLWVAFKADILSLTSFQIGMYAWQLAIYFIFHGQIHANSVFYWFNIQVGLIIGLLTTYPVNYLLIKTGIKVPCAA